MTGSLPSWLLDRPKPLRQRLLDAATAPVRMAMMPDARCEAMHVTSLRAERIAVALPELRGRVLDVGAGDNLLVRCYRERAVGAARADADQSVGVDVVDWGGGVVVIDDSAALPFDDGRFDTVVFLACLNHIPDRTAALREAFRVVRPGGRLVASMIGPVLGEVGHRIWWYSEDKHRHTEDGEVGGLHHREMRSLIEDAGFRPVRCRRFVYGMNRLYVADHP